MMTGDPMLILLADDDSELRFILARVLKKEGHDVYEMGDFQSLYQRLEQYAQLPVEDRKKVVLVSDVYMPGGTAITAVASLKEALDGLPIIFITSARDDDIAEQGMRLGAKAVLSKPVDMDELKQLIRSISDSN
jgi:CheY-like chemotaxis protein